MVATLSLRVYTGTNAGTESAAQTAIELVDADALGGGGIAPGTNSYERWLRVNLDTAPVGGVSNFWLQSEGELPTGVTLRFGVTDTGATPQATTSVIATTELVAGRRFIWDTNTYSEQNETTRYLVLQLQADSSAPSGAIEQQTPEIGWSEF